MCSTSICKLMRICFSSSSALDNCLTSFLCWAFSSSTEALRSLSWFLSSSSVRGVRGECRISGDGVRPEEEDGEAGRWPEFGRGSTEGLVGSCALSGTEMVGTGFLREVSRDLVLVSGSSLTLSFSLLSSTEESRWTADKEAGVMICERGRRSVTRGRDTVG